MGVGEAVNDTKKVRAAAADLEKIAGQKPVITHARKSIAGFKVRENMPLGVKVTLRKQRMYEFLDRLVNIALPRVRDFRGLNPNSFDGRGNYAMGIKEHIIFPEIDYDQIDQVWGMDIVVCTTAQDRRRGAGAAQGFQFPLPAVSGRAEDETWQRPAPSRRTTSRKKLAKQFAGKRAKLKAHDQGPERSRWRSASPRSSSSPSCRAIRRRAACATAAKSPAVRAATTARCKHEPYRAARAGQFRADPRPGQVELVRRDTNEPY